MKVLAEDLARLCYNAIQFSAKDSGLGGVVWFCSDEFGLAVFASDDYVAMMDRALTPADFSGMEFHLGLKELKELERWLRDKEGEVELETVTPAEGPDLLEISAPEYWTLPLAPTSPDFTRVIEIVHSEPNPFAEDYYPASRQPFAIRAERFAKFRLLRTPESPSCKDGYPVDFLWDGHLIRWRCGPFLSGVVAPLARYSFEVGGQEIRGIKSLYQEEEGVLWDEVG